MTYEEHNKNFVQNPIIQGFIHKLEEKIGVKIHPNNYQKLFDLCVGAASRQQKSTLR